MATMKTFTITLSEQELNIVFGAISNLPYRDSVQLIQNLQKQYQEQLPAENPGKGIEKK